MIVVSIGAEAGLTISLTWWAAGRGLAWRVGVADLMPGALDCA